MKALTSFAAGGAALALIVAMAAYSSASSASRLRERTKKLERKLADEKRERTSTVGQLATEATVLRANVDRVATAVSEARTAAETASEEIRRLQEQMRSLASRLDRLADENRSLSARVARLSARVDAAPAAARRREPEPGRARETVVPAAPEREPEPERTPERKVAEVMEKYAPRAFALFARRMTGEMSDAELRESLQNLRREAEEELGGELSPEEMEELRRRLGGLGRPGGQF